MLDFYNKASLGLLGLLLISALATYLCVQRAFLHVPLLPAEAGELSWVAQPHTDIHQGGISTVTINDARYSLDFESNLSPQAQYPFASVVLLFKDREGQPRLVDLSAFTSLSFSAKCSPANVLAFIASTVEEETTNPNDFLSYRTPMTYFSCDEDWKQVELDLTRLETPQWWLDRFQLKLSKTEYKLDQVRQIQFGSSYQSPMETASRVQLHELELHGRDWRYMYFLGAFLFLAWSAYGVWFFRQHTQALIRDLRSKIQKDRPLVAYQQLSVEPQRDRERAEILRFMGTEYANAELNLDSMVAAIGVNRTKINDILKTELGFTFTGYLNKLRLTEAARLLAEKEKASIAEIAYSVGYKNVSYFNKLFKEEYGCTPKNFKSLYDQTPVSPGARTD